jgi:hypothetical protein
MRGVAKQASIGSGKGPAGAAARVALVAVSATFGFCHAQEAERDTLQLALSSAPAALRTDTGRRSLSMSATAPLAGTTSTASPATDVGVSWRAPLASRAVDITGWRRMGPPPDALVQIQQRDPSFGARLEVPLAKPRSGFTSDLRFIGMQLDNGARIGVRKSNGNPMLYYRQQF